MLTTLETNKLMHNIKRASKVLKFIHSEEDHDKRQTLISLLVDELDRMSEDILELKEKNTDTQMYDKNFQEIREV